MADRVYAYRALRPRTRWLTWLLYGWLVLSLVEVVPRLALMLGAVGQPINAGSVGTEVFAEAVAGFAGLFLLASMVAFCFWIYRANANLHAFDVGDIDSPVWAVVSYLIPVASLWMGYQVMRDLWNKSGPPDSDLDGNGWLLPVWWTGWVVTNILSNVLLRRNDIFDPTTRAALQLAAPVFNLVTGLALVVILRKLDVAQAQQESLEVF